MVKRIGRILLFTVLILGFLVLLIALFGPPYVQNSAKKSFPLIEGEIRATGLDDQVKIYRDSFGIPHIYGSSHHDLFFAQGYVHAQDRFWQMDFWRHLGAGRLAEFVGSPMVETDKFIRTLGWERVAKQELELLGPEEVATLEAYSAGVNFYLQDHTGVQLSLEYLFLPITNRHYETPPWTPLNSMTWSKAMAWDLRGNIDSEIDRALLLHDLTPQQILEIYPQYPSDHPFIVEGFSSDQEDSDNGSTKSGEFIADQEPLLDTLAYIQSSVTALDELTGGGFESIGSNSWAVSGDLTETGKPYLANDPHLGSQMPSIWYEIGLHCLEKTESCQLDVTGFSFAGVPGIVIGHNDRISWGVTNVGPDVMDLYIEKIHRDDPNLYLTPDGWQELEIITETINIAGKDPLEHQVYLTRHGPVIGDVYGLDKFHEEAGIEVPEYYALTLRWTALEPTCIYCAIWDFNLADDWEDFREAAEEFSVPSQNLLYADVDGNIAYQMPGNIPIRMEGHDGMLPAPGWTTEYDWQGYIPFKELPYQLNPSEGYIVTANNAVVGPEYPYMISNEWSLGFRAQRIVDLLETAPEPITMAYIKKMQGDNFDMLARDLVPLLVELQFQDQELAAAQQLLRDWDYQADMDSAPAALFMTFWQNLINNTIQDDLPDYYDVGVESRAKEIFRQLVGNPGSAWWDDTNTKEVESRDAILMLSFEESYQQLIKEQGKDLSAWNWGSLHTTTFHNQVMSSFPFIKNVFDTGPFPTSGGNAIINATGWDPSAPFLVDWLPSMRMVVDLNDLSNSVTIHTTGQSGHAYHPHYIDMADLWRKIYYHSMLWTPQQVKGSSESLLILTP